MKKCTKHHIHCEFLIHYVIICPMWISDPLCHYLSHMNVWSTMSLFVPCKFLVYCVIIHPMQISHEITFAAYQQPGKQCLDFFFFFFTHSKIHHFIKITPKQKQKLVPPNFYFYFFTILPFGIAITMKLSQGHPKQSVAIHSLTSLNQVLNKTNNYK